MSLDNALEFMDLKMLSSLCASSLARYVLNALIAQCMELG